MSVEKNVSYQNVPFEITFSSTTDYKEPFNEIEFDVLFTEPSGREILVPGFWAGKSLWKVRYASPIIGKHKFKTICSDGNNSDLNGNEGLIEIKEYKGKNSLYKHGKIKVSKDKRHIEHNDGTPFFWLGDTWWKALTSRCRWPKIFKTVTKDRVDKGFTVVHIADAMGPEVTLPEPGEEIKKEEMNEGGYCWDKEFESINPEYFDFADLKIKWLVKSGIVPCIFGPWGYFLHFLGIEKIKKHWRYLISRWGSYPVIWCVSGEVRLPYYDYLYKDSKKMEQFKRKQGKGWSEVAAFIKEKDPFKNLTTVHPSPGDKSYSSRDVFSNPDLFDIDMLQTGHSDFSSFDRTFKTLDKSLSSSPTKPVINGEPCYEGIMGGSLQNTQRFLFWTHMLSGTAGHSYGTDGIWTFRSEENYMSILGRWTTDTWDKAMNLPGSYQIGYGKKFLQRYDWSKFKPHQEWVIPHSNRDNKYLHYCAGIEEQVRIIYIPAVYFYERVLDFTELKVVSIEEDSDYIAFFFDPRKNTIIDKQKVNHDEKNQWSPPKYGWFNWPSMEDWVLVLENKNK